MRSRLSYSPDIVLNSPYLLVPLRNRFHKSRINEIPGWRSLESLSPDPITIQSTKPFKVYHQKDFYSKLIFATDERLPFFLPNKQKKSGNIKKNNRLHKIGAATPNKCHGSGKNRKDSKEKPGLADEDAVAGDESEVQEMNALFSHRSTRNGSVQEENKAGIMKNKGKEIWVNNKGVVYFNDGVNKNDRKFEEKDKIMMKHRTESERNGEYKGNLRINKNEDYINEELDSREEDSIGQFTKGYQHSFEDNKNIKQEAKDDIYKEKDKSNTKFDLNEEIKGKNQIGEKFEDKNSLDTEKKDGCITEKTPEIPGIYNSESKSEEEHVRNRLQSTEKHQKHLKIHQRDEETYYKAPEDATVVSAILRTSGTLPAHLGSNSSQNRLNSVKAYQAPRYRLLNPTSVDDDYEYSSSLSDSSDSSEAPYGSTPRNTIKNKPASSENISKSSVSLTSKLIAKDKLKARKLDNLQPRTAKNNGIYEAGAAKEPQKHSFKNANTSPSPSLSDADPLIPLKPPSVTIIKKIETDPILIQSEGSSNNILSTTTTLLRAKDIISALTTTHTTNPTPTPGSFLPPIETLKPTAKTPVPKSTQSNKNRAYKSPRQKYSLPKANERNSLHGPTNLTPGSSNFAISQNKSKKIINSKSLKNRKSPKRLTSGKERKYKKENEKDGGLQTKVSIKIIEAPNDLEKSESEEGKENKLDLNSSIEKPSDGQNIQNLSVKGKMNSSKKINEEYEGSYRKERVSGVESRRNRRRNIGSRRKEKGDDNISENLSITGSERSGNHNENDYEHDFSDMSELESEFSKYSIIKQVEIDQKFLKGENGESVERKKNPAGMKFLKSFLMNEIKKKVKTMDTVTNFVYNFSFSILQCVKRLKQLDVINVYNKRGSRNKKKFITKHMKSIEIKEKAPRKSKGDEKEMEKVTMGLKVQTKTPQNANKSTRKSALPTYYSREITLKSLYSNKKTSETKANNQNLNKSNKKDKKNKQDLIEIESVGSDSSSLSYNSPPDPSKKTLLYELAHQELALQIAKELIKQNTENNMSKKSNSHSDYSLITDKSSEDSSEMELEDQMKEIAAKLSKTPSHFAFSSDVNLQLIKKPQLFYDFQELQEGNFEVDFENLIRKSYKDMFYKVKEMNEAGKMKDVGLKICNDDEMTEEQEYQRRMQKVKMINKKKLMASKQKILEKSNVKQVLEEKKHAEEPNSKEGVIITHLINSPEENTIDERIYLRFKHSVFEENK